ncbi:MAG: hypothetical protein K1X88_30095 [Nannocystaceae bacterium]|nr:hypothetical protein [Nannocystaceae bacterium]
MPRPALAHLPLAALLLGVGTLHFTRPAFFLAIMPPWLPWHAALVWLSGVAEVVAGALLLPASTRRHGGWLAAATMIAVWPANWHHALAGGVHDPALPAWMGDATVAWIRLPLQLPLVAFAIAIARGRYGALPSSWASASRTAATSRSASEAS